MTDEAVRRSSHCATSPFHDDFGLIVSLQINIVFLVFEGRHGSVTFRPEVHASDPVYLLVTWLNKQTFFILCLPVAFAFRLLLSNFIETHASIKRWRKSSRHPCSLARDAAVTPSGECSSLSNSSRSQAAFIT